MHKLKHIFTFIAPYVKPYWGRLLAGLFFGVLFGASNGLVLWATKTLLDRLDPQTVAATASGTNANKQQPQTDQCNEAHLLYANF